MTTEKRTLIEHLTLWFTWRRLIFALLMTFFLVSILFPFYWMVSSSFKSYQEIGGRTPVYIPAKLRLDAFRELFDPSSKQFQNFQVNIINTLKVSIPTALIAVILSVFGAYSVARLSFIGKDFLLNGILLVYMFPGVLLISPLFAMLSKIGVHLGFVVQDNLGLLIITYLAQTLPVALYMLTNYFRAIPDEIEQAALIDGWHALQVIWRVTMPLAIPALVSVGIYTFMIAWNEFLCALVFLNSRELFTMPIKINTIFNDPTPRPHVVIALQLL